MKKAFFKTITCAAFMLLPLTSVQAQSIKESFSAEGRKNWKPEVTVRGNLGIYAGGFAVTGGVRIDEKRTLGPLSITRELFLQQLFCMDEVLLQRYTISAHWPYNLVKKYETGTNDMELVKASVKNLWLMYRHTFSSKIINFAGCKQKYNTR